MEHDSVKAAAATIRTALDLCRPATATEWVFPRWYHPFASSIMPFCVVDRTGVRPLGTAFAIAKCSVLATAEHNFRNALHDSWRGHELLSREEWPEVLNVPGIGLAVIHQKRTSPQGGELSIQGILRGQSAPPSDLFFAQLTPEPLETIIFPLSLSVPRIGERLTCVGYPKMSVTGGWIPLDEIRSGSFDWSGDTKFELKATEGRVTHIFTHEFAAGYSRGPTVVLDCEVERGQSGGPVFNEAGYVCGVVSAGVSSFFPAPQKASAVSLLFPAYAIELLLTGADSSAALAPWIVRDLISANQIRTDGREVELGVSVQDEKRVVHPFIHTEDFGSVFETFADYQAGRPANPMG